MLIAKPMTKAVKDLRTGDILSSGTEVLSNPVSLLRTPKGKVEIKVRYSSGEVKTQQWGKFTNVTIKEL